MAGRAHPCSRSSIRPHCPNILFILFILLALVDQGLLDPGPDSSPCDADLERITNFDGGGVANRPAVRRQHDAVATFENPRGPQRIELFAQAMQRRALALQPRPHHETQTLVAHLQSAR